MTHVDNTRGGHALASPRPEGSTMEGFEKALRERLKRFGKKDAEGAKTVNVKDLFDDGTAPNNTEKQVRFNPHDPGSSEWLKYGQEHGVWVNGVSALDFIQKIDPNNNKKARVDNTVRFLAKVAEMLQGFQDEMARMAIGGATPRQMKKFAAKVFQTSGDTRINTLNDTLDGDATKNKFGFANVMKMLLTQDPKVIEQKYLNKLKEYNGKRNEAGLNQLNGLEAGFSARMDEAQEASGYKPVEGFERERKLSSDRLKIIVQMEKEISELPRSEQTIAWDLLEASLDEAYALAETQESPEMPALTHGQDLVLPPKKNSGMLGGIPEAAHNALRKILPVFDESGSASAEDTRRIFNDVWYV